MMNHFCYNIDFIWRRKNILRQICIRWRLKGCSQKNVTRNDIALIPSWDSKHIFALGQKLAYFSSKASAQVRVRWLDRACSGSVTVRRWVSLPVDCHPPWLISVPTTHPPVTTALTSAAPPRNKWGDISARIKFSSDDKMTDCEGGGCATDLDSRWNSIFPPNFAALRAPTFPLAVPLLTIVRLNSNWEEFRQIRDSIREIPRDAPPVGRCGICAKKKSRFVFKQNSISNSMRVRGCILWPWHKEREVNLKGDMVNLTQDWHQTFTT